MAAAAGRVTGVTSTEGVLVRGEPVAEGDYSGPEGARLALRRREVETAILETARGGLLRRGLTVERADVAVVTNIAADHLGEFGVQDLRQLAETKLLVARAIGPAGRVVLNADDPVLVEAAAAVRGADRLVLARRRQRGDPAAPRRGRNAPRCSTATRSCCSPAASARSSPEWRRCR